MVLLLNAVTCGEQLEPDLHERFYSVANISDEDIYVSDNYYVDSLSQLRLIPAHRSIKMDNLPVADENDYFGPYFKTSVSLYFYHPETVTKFKDGEIFKPDQTMDCDYYYLIQHHYTVYYPHLPKTAVTK